MKGDGIPLTPASGPLLPRKDLDDYGFGHPPGSGAAKRLPDALGGLRRIGIGFESLVEPVGMRQNLRQSDKAIEALRYDSSFDDLFDAMIARNARGIDLPHRRGAGSRIRWSPRQTRAPPRRPLVIVTRIRE